MCRVPALWVLPLLGLVLSESAAAQAPGPKPAPDRWAIVIGVDGQEDPAIPRCRKAVSDAVELERWLVSAARWPSDHILVLTDGGNLRHGDAKGSARRFSPTKDNLEWAVKEWLGSRLKPNDLVLIYFAGHAISLPKRPDALPGYRPRDYLLPIDARAVDYDRTGWSLDRSLDALAERGRNPVVAWLDTSSVGRGEGVPLPADATRDPARILRSLARWPGVSAWMAGSDRPTPEPKAAGEPGPFLKAMLDGMGTPDAPATLLSCLDVARNNPTLARQGFLSIGGLDPAWTLWPGDFAPLVRPNGELVVQAGHADRVGSIVIASDGRWMATGSMDSTVRVWSLADRACLRVVSGFSQGVRSLALSPDGRTLAAGDGIGQVRVWSRQESEPRSRTGPPPHSGAVDAIRFLPDSRGLVSLDLQEGKALLWNLATPNLAPRQLLDAQVVAVAAASRRAPVVLALADATGKVHLLRPDGTVARVLARPDAPVVALAFSPDGLELAVAEEGGRVARFEVAGGKAVGSPTPDAAGPTSIAYAGTGELFDRAGGKVRRSSDLARPLALPSEAGTLAVSADGRWLAFADEAVGGRTHLYKVGSGFAEGPLAPRLSGRTEATAVAFSPDGTSLVAGEASGGLQVWSLPDGKSAWTVAPSRRRVAHLAASPDKSRLLEINAPDGQASVWNLEEGHVRPIPGSWSSGLFLDPKTLVMAESVERGGNLRVVEIARGTPIDRQFVRPVSAEGDRPVNTTFDKLALSPDRRWVAAGSKAGQSPLIAVWEVGSGKLLGAIQADGLDLHSLAISPDGKRLLATIDARAIVWDLTDGRPADRPRKAHDLEAAEPGNPASALTAGAWLADGRVALGTIGGRVQVWNPADDSTERLAGGTLAGAVRSLAATPNGEWLAAAGEDRALRVWPIREPRAQPISFDVFPNHQERINSLVAWPDGQTLVSGGDDTQTRFWSLKGQSLLGTLSLADAPATPLKPGARPDPDPAPPEWVCTTPLGLFDASGDGADHVRWRVGEGTRSLDQVADKGYYFHRLTAALAKGEAPEKPAPPIDNAPAISLEWSKPLNPEDQEVTLTVSLGEAGLPDLRLYQQGVPIRGKDDFKPTDDPKRFTTSVRLRSGENRFFVMAGQPNRVDGRSGDLTALFAGPDSPPRLHIVALGISAYQRRALQYADDDARALADFLHQRGLSPGGEPGLKVLLTDREVEPLALDRHFRALRDEVKDRPQDTIVVFMAGHTDVLDKKFCLLLPDYPFLEDEPLTVASRVGDGRAAKNPKAVLPYGSIYTQLARLGALQRMVIVDACQAEAIKSDPQVELIRRYMATDSRKAKTAYLLAARAGEAATEVSDLKHGLLSYVVLRGLRADTLRTEGDPLRGSSVPPDADLNGDGIIATRELERYVGDALPVLATRYPSLVRRGPDEPPASKEPDPAGDGAFRLQSDDVSFPLIRAPKPTP